MDDDGPYSSQQAVQSGPNLNISYVKSLQGILKVVELVLCIIVLICASVSIEFAMYGAGWVQFVAISALFTTLVLLLFNLFNIFAKLPAMIPWPLIIFVYYCAYTLLYFIAALVCAVRGHWHSSVGASAFFAFAATAVYAADTFFQFRAWREGQLGNLGHSTQQTTTTSTTATTTHVETGWQQY